MTSVDWWPEQNGRLTDGLTITCNSPSGGITEGAFVDFDTSVASQIVVKDSTADAAGWGMALKSASSAGEAVPVLVYGLAKVVGTGGTVLAGQALMSTSTALTVKASTVTTAKCVMFGGNSHVLGTAMQGTSNATDSFIAFIGRAI
jgi:hypothetical protein